MILNSEKILILLKGDNKREVLKNIIENNLNFVDFPVIKILEHTDVTIHFVQ